MILLQIMASKRIKDYIIFYQDYQRNENKKEQNINQDQFNANNIASQLSILLYWVSLHLIQSQ